MARYALDTRLLFNMPTRSQHLIQTNFMKKYTLRLLAILSISIASCVKDRLGPASTIIKAPTGDTLMYYWNFNSEDSSQHTPDFGIIAGARFDYDASYIDFTVGSSLNIKGTDTAAGQSLRVRNPSTSVTFHMPTTNFDSIRLSFAEQRSGSGSDQNAIYYTVDGTNFISTAFANNVYTVSTDFELHTFDFTADTNVKHNPKFAVKIVFTTNNTGISGNDRFDNVSLSGVRK